MNSSSFFCMCSGASSFACRTTLIRNGSSSGNPLERPLRSWAYSGSFGHQSIFAWEKSMSTLRTVSVIGSGSAVIASPLAVPQQSAGRCLGALAVLERDLAVDDRVAVALGPLDAAPVAAREVVGHLVGQQREVLVVVDDDVGRRALDELSPILEPRAVGRQRRHAVVGLLEAHQLLLPDPLDDAVGGEGTGGEELLVGAAVGHAPQ